MELEGHEIALSLGGSPGPSPQKLVFALPSLLPLPSGVWEALNCPPSTVRSGTWVGTDG